MTQFSNNKYDLEERTVKFGESIIDFLKKVQENSINSSSIKQIVRSATSVGANYFEANNASSRNDFRNKIYICKKEANETKYWIRILVKTNPEIIESARISWKEAQELNLIFQKIINTLNENNKSKKLEN